MNFILFLVWNFAFLLVVVELGTQTLTIFSENNHSSGLLLPLFLHHHRDWHADVDHQPSCFLLCSAFDCTHHRFQAYPRPLAAWQYATELHFEVGIAA